MKYLALISGWYKLKFGFCPQCYSSPPNPTCFVCLGDREYGHEASKEKRQEWWLRFKGFWS